MSCSAPMKQDLLCDWLGVPKTVWPPDPWTLLGLSGGEPNLAVIEQRVQERIAKLRTYQLSYPEEATEGMNRLAEAFIAAAEASSRRAVPVTIATAALPKAASSKDETSVIKQTRLDWRAEPPPVRVEPANAQAPCEPDEPTEILVAQPFVAPAKPVRREIDRPLVHQLGHDSEEATSGVGTIDATLARVEATRRLLTAWDKAGKLLQCKTTKISPKESEYFEKRMQEIDAAMRRYPAFLGRPGKPGYRLAALAMLQIPLLIVRAMGQDQREDLLFDWKLAREVLLEHRKYLRKHLQSLRGRSAVGLFVHAVRSAVNDYPRDTLIAVSILLLLAIAGGVMMWKH